MIKLASDRDVHLMKEIIQESQTIEKKRQKYVHTQIVNSVNSIEKEIEKIEKGIELWQKNKNQKEITEVIISNWEHAHEISHELNNKKTFLLLSFVEDKVIQNIQYINSFFLMNLEFDNTKSNHYIPNFTKVKESINEITIHASNKNLN